MKTWKHREVSNLQSHQLLRPGPNRDVTLPPTTETRRPADRSAPKQSLGERGPHAASVVVPFTSMVAFALGALTK